jgi:hypothetical protein
MLAERETMIGKRAKSHTYNPSKSFSVARRLTAKINFNQALF